MPSNKYVLQTDGSIRRTLFNEDGTSDIQTVDAERVTKDQNNKFETFESLRTSINFLKTSPIISLPLVNEIASSNRTIISEDKDDLLKNPSFGSSENIKYFNQFNGIFDDSTQVNKVYAEELEMLAGFDMNSIGIIDTTKRTVDTVKFLFIFDYLLESSLYIALAEVITKLFDKTPAQKIYNYFHDILNYPSFSLTIKAEPLAYFLIGLNEFVNTDPKIPELIKNNLVEKSNFSSLTGFKPKYLDNPNAFLVLILSNLADSLFALSKLEHNRILLLIRKFQQESHYHSKTLYKAKEDTSENSIDKLFVEFSQYYFKFIVERMHIGRMIWRRKVNIEFHKNKTINFSNRLSEDRHLRSNNENALQTSENVAGQSADGSGFTGDYKSKYYWREFDSRNEGDNTLSITALPQLLKTNTYIKKVALQNIKHRQNFDDTDENEKTERPLKRLSPEIVKLVEDHLDNEYMPFYFHDLRTNEILAFHAFIDTITDNFTPNYSESIGYGRIDAVQHYIKTTRSINTTFALVSYNQDDHDLMWYQINKLVSMCYPQWSKGIKRSEKDRTAFPFTQMPTASPLIRLRIGDVITSNYSKENLARLHVHGGKIGRQKVSKKEKAENTSSIESGSRRESQVNTPKKIEPAFFLNVNPLDYAYPKLENQNLKNSLGQSKRENKNKSFHKSSISKSAYDALSESDKEMIVVPSKNKKASLKNLTKRPIVDNFLIRIIVRDSKEIEEAEGKKPTSDKKYLIAYAVDESGKKVSDKFYIKSKKALDATLDEYRNVAGSSVVDARRGKTINNPFTAAYESSRGQGLAGFITNLDINYNESTWQTEIKGSRAPMMVKITISFAPVHDIPPGLDHLGEMRAPVYNVGSINRKMFRTPYDNIEKSENEK